MKRNIIALIGATLILFVWQSMSWMVLPVHEDFAKYTPNDAAIMTVLNSSLTESGAYMMPGMDPSKEPTVDEMKKRNAEMEGKPYALVMYNKEFHAMPPSMMVLGNLLNLVAVLIAISLVNMGIRSGASFGTRFMLVLSLAIFCIFQSALLNWNWMGFPWHFIKGEVIDLVVGWSLCGLFLSWYLGKAQRA